MTLGTVVKAKLHRLMVRVRVQAGTCDFETSDRFLRAA